MLKQQLTPLFNIHFLKALHFFFRKKKCNVEFQNVLFKQIVYVLKKNKLCHNVHTKNLYFRSITHSSMFMLVLFVCQFYHSSSFETLSQVKMILVR